MGIINSLQTLLMLPVVGLKQGMLPIISFNYGARQFQRVKKTVLISIAAATAIVVLGFLIINLIPELLISIFNRDPELLAFSTRALKTWFLCMPVVGSQIISANYFQAIGKPYSATFLTLTRQVILLIPAVIIFPRFWEMEGILFAAPFADFFSAFLTGLWFFLGIKQLDRKSLSDEKKSQTSQMRV
jgi:Na+-driven multidrug efflux pump